MGIKKTRVGIIFGGRSGEHEVSFCSASSIIKAINKDKYAVVPIGITKGGRWISSPRFRISSSIWQNRREEHGNFIE